MVQSFQLFVKEGGRRSSRMPIQRTRIGPSSSSSLKKTFHSLVMAARSAGGESESGSSKQSSASKKRVTASKKGNGSKSNNTSKPAATEKSKTTKAATRTIETGYYDEAFLEGQAIDEDAIYQGDTKFNLMGEAEDVIAPWSIDGFEIDLPDWRPQPAEKYEIVDPSVLEKLDKIENMFGASLRLVSTYDGIWRFIYMGNIRNLIGAEAWTKLILTEDLGLKGIKEVRFETNYAKDYPDDWN